MVSTCVLNVYKNRNNKQKRIFFSRLLTTSTNNITTNKCMHHTVIKTCIQSVLYVCTYRPSPKFGCTVVGVSGRTAVVRPSTAKSRIDYNDGNWTHYCALYLRKKGSVVHQRHDYARRKLTRKQFLVLDVDIILRNGKRLAVLHTTRFIKYLAVLFSSAIGVSQKHGRRQLHFPHKQRGEWTKRS